MLRDRGQEDGKERSRERKGENEVSLSDHERKQGPHFPSLCTLRAESDTGDGGWWVALSQTSRGGREKERIPLRTGWRERAVKARCSGGTGYRSWARNGEHERGLYAERRGLGRGWIRARTVSSASDGWWASSGKQKQGPARAQKGGRSQLNHPGLRIVD